MKLLTTLIVITYLCIVFSSFVPTDALATFVPKTDIFRVPCHNPHYTTDYDYLFRASVHMFWEVQHRDEWCWLKAQAIAESGLKADAVSPVGAQGILQIMPVTWVDLGRGYRPQGGPFDPRSNIIQAARYMAWLEARFASIENRSDQRDLQLAAYNAGVGNIRKATRLAGGKRTWEHIQTHLVKVTGKHSKETIAYVERIHRIYASLQSSVPE